MELNILNLSSVPHMRGGEPAGGIESWATQWVFPTCVGVNRDLDRGVSALYGVPHMRGGEPDREYRAGLRDGVFPTCVGVNRLAVKWTGSRPGVPHMRGGEPRCPPCTYFLD